MRYRTPTSWILVFLVAVFGTASAAIAAAQAVVEQPIVDVGTVAQGSRVEHSFVLENRGDAELEVRQVKPSCGCTVADYPKTVAPGESGTITAALKTDNFTGPIAKSVSVFTSDSDNPKITLVIKAVVQPQVEVTPGYARFIVIEGSGTESSTQTLRTLDGPELELRSVRSPYPFVEASFVRGEEKGEWQVNLSIDKNAAPIGPLADFIEVETNHPKRRLVKIPVSGFVRPVVSVTPRVAELGSHRLEAPFTTTLEVRSQVGKISLEEVSATVAGLEAAIESVEEGKVYKVVLTMTPGMAKGPFQGKVQITTSSKRRPLVEVDVSGTVL